MHICHVNLASGFSGGERQTLEMIKQQLRLGLQLTLVVNPNSPLLGEVEGLGCRVYTAKKFWNLHFGLKKEEFDLIHVHDGKAVHWAYIQHLLYKTPYIITRRIDNPVKKKSYRQYRAASVLVGLSRVICDCLKEACPDSKVERIPSSPVTYSVDEESVKKIRSSYNNKALVIQAANMYEHKGFDVSIRAAEIIEKSHPEVQFVFLGDGRMRQELEKQASELSNVHFAGKQTNMGDWFAAADLMIHPAYTEGLGSVILEALNTGLPVIATRAGGIPDIIESGVNGYLVDIGDAERMADKLVRVLGVDHQKAMIKENIIDSLRDFRIEHTAERYVGIYKSVS
ncbi:glycosyl transferase [Vibrio breoganii]|nr:glycosyltransferase family 4 protein [Vibrio breoganii]PMG05812.1 glycosyl transferase [Vibrio breoganii]